MMFRVLAVLSLSHRASATVLVTGATGRTGSLMYKALTDAGEHVRALTRTAEKASDILGCHACDESDGIYLGDVTNVSSLANAMKGVDTLVIAVGAHGDEPDDVVDSIEWTGVKNQMEALLSGGKDGKRVVLFSSMSTTKAKQHNHVLFDKARAEKYIVEQDIPFAIVKPCGLSDEAGHERELLVGHDDTEPWFGEGFYMIPRADVVSVAAAALMSPPTDKLRFDLCSKLPGSEPSAIKDVLQEAAKMPWQPPDSLVVV